MPWSACARGASSIDEIDPPVGWDRLQAAARIINQYEGARSQRARFEEFGERIGHKLADLVRTGLRLAQVEYEDARAHVETMKVIVNSIFWDYPVILTPAAAGVAPAGLASTGDPSPNAPWTALGVPAISVPLPVDGGAARRADDRRMGPRRRPGRSRRAVGKAHFRPPMNTDQRR